jgi:hypothetical protein
MYGLVGLIAFGAILLLPVIRAVWLPADGEGSDEPNIRSALAALILMLAIDNLLNGAMILPYLLIMGGLADVKRSIGGVRLRLTPNAIPRESSED